VQKFGGGVQRIDGNRRFKPLAQLERTLITEPLNGDTFASRRRQISAGTGTRTRALRIKSCSLAGQLPYLRAIQRSSLQFRQVRIAQFGTFPGTRLGQR